MGAETANMMRYICHSTSRTENEAVTASKIMRLYGCELHPTLGYDIRAGAQLAAHWQATRAYAQGHGVQIEDLTSTAARLAARCALAVQQTAGEAKLDAVYKAVENVVARRHPLTGAAGFNPRILVFSQYKDPLAVLGGKLAGLACPVMAIRGGGNESGGEESTANELAKAAFEAAVRDDAPFVLLVSSKTGGVGLNLQHAGTAMFLDIDPVEAQHQQCRARTYRLGGGEVLELIVAADASGVLDSAFKLAAHDLVARRKLCCPSAVIMNFVWKQKLPFRAVIENSGWLLQELNRGGAEGAAPVGAEDLGSKKCIGHLRSAWQQLGRDEIDKINRGNVALAAEAGAAEQAAAPLEPVAPIIIDLTGDSSDAE